MGNLESPRRQTPKREVQEEIKEGIGYGGHSVFKEAKFFNPHDKENLRQIKLIIESLQNSSMENRNEEDLSTIKTLEDVFSGLLDGKEINYFRLRFNQEILGRLKNLVDHRQKCIIELKDGTIISSDRVWNYDSYPDSTYDSIKKIYRDGKYLGIGAEDLKIMDIWKESLANANKITGETCTGRKISIQEDLLEVDCYKMPSKNYAKHILQSIFFNPIYERNSDKNTNVVGYKYNNVATMSYADYEFKEE